MAIAVEVGITGPRDDYNPFCHPPILALMLSLQEPIWAISRGGREWRRLALAMESLTAYPRFKVKAGLIPWIRGAHGGT